MENMSSDQCGIYKILCLINNNQYVGQSTSFKKRFINHLSSLRRGVHKNAHLQASWNKYGESNFQFIICKLCPENELTAAEQEILNEVDKSHRFNKGEFVSNPLRGVPMSDETKKKLSIAKTGRPGRKLSKEEAENLQKISSTPISQIDPLDGHLVKLWASTTEANKHGFKTIIRSLDNSKIMAYGFFWRRQKPKRSWRPMITDAHIEKIRLVGMRNRKPLLQFDLNNILIREYSSFTEAQGYGYDSKGIRRCITEEVEHYHNSIWKLKDTI